MKKITLFIALVAMSVMSYALNPFAYGLSSQLSEDGAVLTVNYSLNADANSVNVLVLNGEEVVATVPADGITKGTYAVEVATANLPTGVQLTWTVEVNGTSVEAPTQEETMYSLYCPHGLVIDKDPESNYFGRIIVAEGMHGNKGTKPYVSHNADGLQQAGLYTFTPAFTTDSVVYNGGLDFTRIWEGNGYQPWRVKISEDGRIFVSSLDLNGVAVWEVSKDLQTWTPVIAGTQGEDGNILDAEGNFVAGMNVSMDVKGSGEDLTLLLYSCTTGAAAFSQSAFRLDEYALGTATTWTGTPKNILTGGKYALIQTNAEWIYDGEGGYWFGASRGGNAGQPNLAHINADGVEDYRDETTTFYGGDGVLVHNGMLFKGKARTSSTVGNFGVYTISKDENGAPVLTEKWAVVANGIGRNLNEFAVDYAENLYVVGNSGEMIIAYAMPYSGTVATPAAAQYAFQLSGTTSDVEVVELSYDITSDGVMDRMGRRTVMTEDASVQIIIDGFNAETTEYAEALLIVDDATLAATATFTADAENNKEVYTATATSEDGLTLYNVTMTVTYPTTQEFTFFAMDDAEAVTEDWGEEGEPFMVYVVTGAGMLNEEPVEFELLIDQLSNIEGTIGEAFVMGTATSLYEEEGNLAVSGTAMDDAGNTYNIELWVPLAGGEVEINITEEVNVTLYNLNVEAMGNMAMVTAGGETGVSFWLTTTTPEAASWYGYYMSDQFSNIWYGDAELQAYGDGQYTPDSLTVAFISVPDAEGNAVKYNFTLIAGEPAVEPVEMVGVVKRALQYYDATIVLTHEADGTAHIYNVVDGVVAEVSQEGVVPVDPENASDFLAISDIALTEDGKLVATNYMVTQSADDQVVAGDKRGETRIYIWDDLAGTPSILFTSKMSSNWFQSKQGLTMAVKGTSDNMEILMTGIHKSKAWARVSSYRVIEGVYVEPDVNHNDHYYFYDVADAVALETTVGTQYELTASPLGAMNWILDAELINPIEIVESATNNVEISSCVALSADLGKKYNGNTVVTVDDQHLLVAPFATEFGLLAGVKVLDITAGLDAATEVATAYLDSDVEATAAATAVQVVEGGLVVNLVADATIYTLNVELKSEPVYMEIEEEVTDLIIDLDYMTLSGTGNNFGTEIYLTLGQDNADGTFTLDPEMSFVTINGWDATFIEGYAYDIDIAANTAKALTKVELNGEYFAITFNMSSTPVEALDIVITDAVVAVDTIPMFGDMVEYALNMTANWTNPADGVTYPVLVEIPVYYPESTEPSEIMSTVTVGGMGDTDPWLGFGEGYLTVTTANDVVTATGLVENAWAGFAANITISGKLSQGPTTGIDNVQVELNAVKTIKNGQLIIIRDGVEYNVQGAVVK